MIRRRALLAGAGAALGAPLARAQPRPAGRPLVIAQLHDTSAAQQDVAKDFLIGSRAAWQEINARGGLRGRPVAHLALEVDGGAASVRTALAACRDNPACIALSGSCGDPVASRLVELMRQDALPLAHVAPWLQTSTLEADERTFAIFATRQEQIAHALRSLSVMGVQDVGAVYAGAQDLQLYGADVERIAQRAGLRLQTFQGEGDLARLGQRLQPGTPAVLLFLGGTPELAAFTQGLERQQRQRYLIALADVNLQTLAQMGAGRATPVIATQAVPMVNAGLPVVRAYRDALQRLFDEPPTALSLAGYIAARYTAEVVGGIDGVPTRAGVLAAFQRREARDIGGFAVVYDARRRSAGFVTQSMLAADGRLIG